MGLSIGVGVLADLLENDEEGADWLREDVETLNRVLAENDLPAHTEPESLPPLEPRGDTSFPYDFLHYLRRAYVCLLEDRPLRLGAMTEADERMIDEATEKHDGCHLLCHSDAEGFYLPQDFPQVLYDDDLPGTMAGSSPRLLADLTRVAPSLGIALDRDTLSDAEATRLAMVDEHDPLLREKLVWLALFETARLSVEHGTLVVFG